MVGCRAGRSAITTSKKFAGATVLDAVPVTVLGGITAVEALQNLDVSLGVAALRRPGQDDLFEAAERHSSCLKLDVHGRWVTQGLRGGN